ncbi:hypothetical protein ACFFWE_09365 [Sphaerisporangium melleum]|nr:hypothetical protein [Sphaerisporangium melleum]
MPRPKTGQTPVRYVRLGDEIWEQVEWIAHEDGSSNTDVVKTALQEYIAKRRRLHRLQQSKAEPGDD